jgi:hypothetical protein
MPYWLSGQPRKVYAPRLSEAKPKKRNEANIIVYYQQHTKMGSQIPGCGARPITTFDRRSSAAISPHEQNQVRVVYRRKHGTLTVDVSKE